jgi:hypothetical protein
MAQLDMLQRRSCVCAAAFRWYRKLRIWKERKELLICTMHCTSPDGILVNKENYK